MNERDFKAKLRKLLKPHCYIQSMYSLGVAGTPDLWLSGVNDLWLEVKYDTVTKGAVKPKLSPLQNLWLNERLSEGRNVAVLVGTATNEGILYLDGAWARHSSERRPLPEIIKEIIHATQTNHPARRETLK